VSDIVDDDIFVRDKPRTSPDNVERLLVYSIIIDGDFL
jgi:hypothetical protein